MPPVTPTPTPTPVAKQIVPTPPDLKTQLEEMDRRTAGSREQAEGILRDIEDKEQREMLGLDIEFDISKLITQGIVEKRGIKIMDNLYLDMHTLSKAEDILAEQMVDQVLSDAAGGIKLSKPYYEARALAILVMSVTRCNNRSFPVPPLESDKRKSEEFKKAWDDKILLLNTFLQFSGSTIDSLTFVYMNLDKADILVEGAKQKKSSRP